MRKYSTPHKYTITFCTAVLYSCASPYLLAVIQNRIAERRKLTAEQSPVSPSVPIYEPKSVCVAWTSLHFEIGDSKPAAIEK
jgi:hypothetical protein